MLQIHQLGYLEGKACPLNAHMARNLGSERANVKQKLEADCRLTVVFT